RWRRKHRLAAPDWRSIGERVVDDADAGRAGDQPSRERIAAQHAPRMKRPHDGAPRSPHRELRQPMVVSEVGVDDVEAVMVDEPAERIDRAGKGERVLRSGDDGVREIVMPDLLLQLVTADVGVMRVDARLAKRLGFGERRSGSAGPSVAGSEVKNLHAAAMVHSAPSWQSSPNSSKPWPARSAKRRCGPSPFRK